MALSLSIGVLIDDAIVVRENIVRHMERGEDRMTAARNGTAEIGLAVTATTFSIIAVFIPVAFMGGGAGEWFRPFALTVATSVLVNVASWNLRTSKKSGDFKWPVNFSSSDQSEAASIFSDSSVDVKSAAS